MTDVTSSERGRCQATYFARKDEIERLREQVRALEASLHELTEERTTDEKNRLDTSITLKTMYSKGIHLQQLQLAGAQSLLSSFHTTMQSTSAPVPLTTFIHLPVDAAQRGEILSAMRERKLLDAFQFMAARTSCHDLRVALHQSEQATLLNGDIVVTAFSVDQFDRGHSVRQVYEAFHFFSANQEISVTENLGVLTICENDVEGEEDMVSQMRFVATPIDEFEVDLNLVRFETCVDATSEMPAYALGTIDYVDHDDLYPYQPHRGRNTTTTAWLMVEVPSTTSTRVVAMARWSYNRFTPPHGSPLPKELEAQVAARMMHWCDLTPKVMTEWLTLQRPII